MELKELYLSQVHQMDALIKSGKNTPKILENLSQYNDAELKVAALSGEVTKAKEFNEFLESRGKALETSTHNLTQAAKNYTEADDDEAHSIAVVQHYAAKKAVTYVKAAIAAGVGPALDTKAAVQGLITTARDGAAAAANSAAKAEKEIKLELCILDGSDEENAIHNKIWEIYNGADTVAGAAANNKAAAQTAANADADAKLAAAKSAAEVPGTGHEASSKALSYYNLAEQNLSAFASGKNILEGFSTSIQNIDFEAKDIRGEIVSGAKSESFDFVKNIAAAIRTDAGWNAAHVSGDVGYKVIRLMTHEYSLTGDAAKAVNKALNTLNVGGIAVDGTAIAQVAANALPATKVAVIAAFKANCGSVEEMGSKSYKIFQTELMAGKRKALELEAAPIKSLKEEVSILLKDNLSDKTSKETTIQNLQQVTTEENQELANLNSKYNNLAFIEVAVYMLHQQTTNKLNDMIFRG